MSSFQTNEPGPEGLPGGALALAAFAFAFVAAFFFGAAFAEARAFGRRITAVFFAMSDLRDRGERHDYPVPEGGSTHAARTRRRARASPPRRCETAGVEAVRPLALPSPGGVPTRT